MPSYEEVQLEFTTRDQQVKDVLEKERKEKEVEKQRRVDTRRKAMMRSGPKGDSDA